MKKNVYMFVMESLYCSAEINIVNQLYFNKINFKIVLVYMWFSELCFINADPFKNNTT